MKAVTVIPASAENASVRRQNLAAVSLRSSVSFLGVRQSRVVVDGMVKERGAHAAAPIARPSFLYPPPSGIRPSFLTSTWTSLPGAKTSQRTSGCLRTTRPVACSR